MHDPTSSKFIFHQKMRLSQGLLKKTAETLQKSAETRGHPPRTSSVDNPRGHLRTPQRPPTPGGLGAVLNFRKVMF